VAKEYKEIIAPQLGVNDESAILVEWFFNHKEKVLKDDLVCILESTKATFEVNSPESGYLFILINEKEKIQVNQVIGIIIYDEKLLGKVIAKYKKEDSNQLELKKVSITKKAKELALKHDIDILEI